MKEEEWRDIQGYEGYYQVSNLGRVRSLDRYKSWMGTKAFVKGRILKGGKNQKGYRQVLLSKDGKSIAYIVHRLVAQAFIHNPNNLPFINHKDEVKDNNNVDNLEWCDNVYNCNYGTAQKRRVEKHLKPVLQYTLDGEFVKEYKSITEASQQTGIKCYNISRCCNVSFSKSPINGKYYQCKSAGGYKWVHKE